MIAVEALRYEFQAWRNLVPEPMGVIAAAVYLVFIFLFIPFPFYEWLNECVRSGEARWD